MSSEIRVLVVDDSAVFLNACRNVVESSERFSLAGTASSGEEAIEQAVELEPDLVLMDVRMPGIGGIEAASRIHELLPETTLVMLTADSVEPECAWIYAVVHKRALSPAALEDLWKRRERERGGSG